MDAIANFSEYCIAQESAAVLALAAAASIAAIVGVSNASANKAAVQRAQSKAAYFEAHNIPPEEQADYDKKILNRACKDMSALINNFIKEPKNKKHLESMKVEITKDVSTYIGEKFQQNKLHIKFGAFVPYDPGEYHMTDVKYDGEGFIPDDNLEEIGMFAARAVMIEFGKALQAKYAEEIKSRIISIDIDFDYGIVTID